MCVCVCKTFYTHTHRFWCVCASMCVDESAVRLVSSLIASQGSQFSRLFDPNRHTDGRRQNAGSNSVSVVSQGKGLDVPGTV